MSLNYQQAFEQARAIGESAEISIVISTNQDNGIVAYLSGQLTYHPSHSFGYSLFPESMSTKPDAPLIAQFSDRTFPVGDVPVDPPFDLRPSQNFSVLSEDKVGFSITPGYTTSGALAHFTLQNWGNAQYSVIMQPIGDLLYGLGAPIGNLTYQAIYTLAFLSVNKPEVLH